MKKYSKVEEFQVDIPFDWLNFEEQIYFYCIS